MNKRMITDAVGGITLIGTDIFHLTFFTHFTSGQAYR